MPVTTAPQAVTAGERTVRRNATSSTAVVVGRIGFVARGVVYLIVGWLALLAAVGRGGAVTDNQGAIQAIAAQPYAPVLLGIVAFGLLAYALWSLVRAIFDPERRGHDASGVASRVGYAVAAVTYGGLAVATAKLALGTGSGGTSSDASAQDWTARLLQAPFGSALVIGAGLILIGVAIALFVKAYRASFRNDLNLEGITGETRLWVIRAGRMGLAAQGVVFGLIGIFLIQASRHDNASEAVGLAGALEYLAAQQYGQILLGIVALGLCMYGLFSFVEARYRRLKR